MPSRLLSESCRFNKTPEVKSLGANDPLNPSQLGLSDLEMYMVILHKMQ